ncbi:peptidase M15 [Tardibacter chloracetimidivorans]|uniref:Peptidase M15 n=1 Tax=Tardibacter chloracetimidivorans TaxID=1921510 RepID=A0A1L3ZY16_9SPHN|nr:M15 family metallopeptidase [Tardibacter chloracetimidivorans]API60526.1 peptidase M15 [Tardibacter chloracetimidivorans]
MAYTLSIRSLSRLEGVHPDLVKVIRRAIEITPIDFAVIEGLRTRERQKELVAAGASKTMNSRHITGHAVDIAPWVGGTIRWDWPLFHKLAPAVKQAAADVGVPVTWGGDWRSFKDGPHWELPRKQYP